MNPQGVLLPIHPSFYGDAHPDDLLDFFAYAGQALREFGFSRIKTLDPETENEKELWGVGDLRLEGNPPQIVTPEGEQVGLNINWLELIDCDSEEILEELEHMTY